MLNKLIGYCLLAMSSVAFSACDQFDLDELRKKATPSTPDISLSARLTGSQLVQSRSGGGLGAFTGTYNQQTNVLAYTVAFSSVPFSIPVEVLHLYRGAPGTVGLIAYTLPSTTNGTITLTEADEALLLGGNLYIEAEAQTREGEPLFAVSRGTILRQLPTPVPVPNPEIVLTAPVNIGQTFPASTFNGVYNKETNVLTYYMTVLSDLSQFGGVHIHRGVPGSNGPTIATLSFDRSYWPHGVVSVPEADEALLLSGGTYVDVHSATSPNRAISEGTIVPQ